MVDFVASTQSGARQVAPDDLNAAFAAVLPLAGGELTGPLALAADPTAPAHAATKRYVDAKLATPASAPASTGTTSGADLTAETNARIAADAAINQSLATESAARTAADTTLTASLAAETTARLNLANIVTRREPLAAAGTFPEVWGFSPSVSPGGEAAQQSKAVDGNLPGQPSTWIEAVYAADAPVQVDFAGAYLGSIPLGVYVQHRQTGTLTTNNAGTHSIMAYGVNAASGNNDVVAVSGRVRKETIAGGIGDACGVWGSAYSESTVRSGGVMGIEAHIYQNAAGMAASDRLNADWSVGIHVYSDSLGSPALAGIAIDSSGQTTGRYGFWNAIIIDKNTFAGGGLTGTVGINCGSWDAFNRPQYGIKFGLAAWHVYAPDQLTLRGDNSVYIDQTASGTSVVFDMGTTATSNVVVRAGGKDIFQILGADGSVHMHQAPYIDL